MKQMTITEALRELSLYDEKIRKAMMGKNFVLTIKATTPKDTREAHEKKIKADYESVTKLIDNRDKIKSAVIQSNATTTVEVNGENMTVAEAIDKKHSIEYKESLLTRLAVQFTDATDTLASHEQKLDSDIDDMMKRIAGSEASDVGDKRKVLEEAYRKSHSYKLFDPIGIEGEIDKLKEEVDGFLKEVDVALSVSNAVTIISVEL